VEVGRAWRPRMVINLLSRVNRVLQDMHRSQARGKGGGQGRGVLMNQWQPKMITKLISSGG
jgi:hypothetical protein